MCTKKTPTSERRSAWYIFNMVEQNSRTRRARPLQIRPTQCNSPGSRRGNETPHGLSFPRLQPTFSWEASHNGGLSSRRLTPLRCILALTVPVARGLGTPFLLCQRLPLRALRPLATLDRQTVYLLVSVIIIQEPAIVNPPARRRTGGCHNEQRPPPKGKPHSDLFAGTLTHIPTFIAAPQRSEPISLFTFRGLRVLLS